MSATVTEIWVQLPVKYNRRAVQAFISGLFLYILDFHSHFIACWTNSDSEAQPLLSQGRPQPFGMATEIDFRFSFQSWNTFFYIWP
jgi:hypothetical protein